MKGVDSQHPHWMQSLIALMFFLFLNSSSHFLCISLPIKNSLSFLSLFSLFSPLPSSFCDALLSFYLWIPLCDVSLVNDCFLSSASLVSICLCLLHQNPVSLHLLHSCFLHHLILFLPLCSPQSEIWLMYWFLFISLCVSTPLSLLFLSLTLTSNGREKERERDKNVLFCFWFPTHV